MAVTKAQIKATTKYESANYDKVLLRMPKGKREAIQEAAQGESLNGYINKAIDEKMSRESEV